METAFVTTAALPSPAFSALARQLLNLSSFPNMLTPSVWLKPGWGNHSVSLSWFHIFLNSSTCFNLLVFQPPGPAYCSFSSKPFERHLTALSPSPQRWITTFREGNVSLPIIPSTSSPGWEFTYICLLKSQGTSLRNRVPALEYTTSKTLKVPD